VVDRVLGQPVGLEPDRGTAMELGDQVGGVAPELGLEHFTEQVVVAVPLLSPVKGDKQEVRPGQGRQPLGRAGDVQDLIAQRPAHALQHRRPVRNDISSGGSRARSSDRR
jgi:hypothetical protein